MDTQGLVHALVPTEFAAHYYRLCERFPHQRPGDPGRCRKRNVLAVLGELGRTPSAELRGIAQLLRIIDTITRGEWQIRIDTPTAVNWRWF